MANPPISPRFLPAGESALVVEFGSTIDPAIHDRVLALDAAIEEAHIPGVLECVPTYRSLMVHFDPRIMATEELIGLLGGLEVGHRATRARRRWHIPACYDAPLAEDLPEVAGRLGLPEEGVVDLHRRAVYRVYMHGFAPGFTFLGGLAPELAISRRAVPRAPVPPGSLLIAGGQALIASCAMPTGWYMIGRTPVRVFDRTRERMFLADVGNELSFERIDRPTFEEMDAAAEAGALVAWVEG